MKRQFKIAAALRGVHASRVGPDHGANKPSDANGYMSERPHGGGNSCISERRSNEGNSCISDRRSTEGNSCVSDR